MTTISVTKLMIDKKPVKALEVSAMSFKALANAVARANDNRPANTSFMTAVTSYQIIERTEIVFSDGTTKKLEHIDLLGLPRNIGMQLRNLVMANDGRSGGKVIAKGDGMLTPIVFKLETPIATGTDGKEFTELEFMAQTYGEVESVVSEINTYQQTLALLEFVARAPGSTLPLPSWAAGQVSEEDGIEIMRNVLPVFTATE